MILQSNAFQGRTGHFGPLILPATGGTQENVKWRNIFYIINMIFMNSQLSNNIYLYLFYKFDILCELFRPESKWKEYNKQFSTIYFVFDLLGSK